MLGLDLVDFISSPIFWINYKDTNSVVLMGLYLLSSM